MNAEGACLTANDYLLAEAIAERVANLLHVPSTHGHLVDARKLADEFGVDRSWVYAHSDELGAIRLGDGSKPRLRFDLDLARETFTCLRSRHSQGRDTTAGVKSEDTQVRKGGRLPHRLPEPGSILAVRARKTR